MPVIPAASQPWKTAAFSADGDLAGGLVERVEVDVVGAAVGVVAARSGRSRTGARSSTSGQDPPLPGGDAVAGRLGELLGAAEVRRRVLPAVGAGEVDQLAGGEGGVEPLARLGVEQVPARPR